MGFKIALSINRKIYVIFSKLLKGKSLASMLFVLQISIMSLAQENSFNFAECLNQAQITGINKNIMDNENFQQLELSLKNIVNKNQCKLENNKPIDSLPTQTVNLYKARTEIFYLVTNIQAENHSASDLNNWSLIQGKRLHCWQKLIDNRIDACKKIQKKISKD